MPDRPRATQNGTVGHAGYARLEERILARDQIGASEAFYDLRREGRPLAEMLSEAVRIHGPLTHVPYHERIDNGFVNFVNNDHCLLSARATIHLEKLLPPEMAGLAMAQTVWYIPTGLDIWNQKILKAPGHYARGYKLPPGDPPVPVVHWPDQEPTRLDGPLRERLDHWLTLVHRGRVLDAYSVFLGLMENPAERETVLGELVFAGLIDVQDRMLWNRSYTTGHKSYRARATVELGDLIGWDRAHHVLYAGALDIAVGPRWYSTYEMACNAVTVFIEEAAVSAIPYAGTTEKERALLANTEPLRREESAALIHALLHEPEPAYVETMMRLLKAGRSPRNMLDTLQLGACQAVLETQGPNAFSMPQHCYEYTNNLAWFWDRFDHPQRIKLLLTAASFLNRTAHHQRHTGEMQPVTIRPPAAAKGKTPDQMLDRMEAAILATDGPESVAWTRAYLDTGADRDRLAMRLALAACRTGNDPHNQEIAQCFIENYHGNRHPDRALLLIGAAQHTACHRKYGDFLECGRRFGEAMGIAALR